MTFELRNTCPMCNALITWTMSGTIACPYCKNELQIGDSDPTGHHLYEIDPDIRGGAFGAFCFHLIPPGTTVCVRCRQIYPKVFECCPKLVDLALAEYGHTGVDWSPNTHNRIVEFLTTNPVVVENTVKLRLLQAEYEDLDSEAAEQIKFCVKSIGLPIAFTDTENRPE